jgi:hypothetical protein
MMSSFASHSVLKRLLCRLVVLFALGLANVRAATMTVSAGANLQELLGKAVGGDVLLLDSGTYAGFTLSDRHFTAEKPLVIAAAPGARPILLGHDFQGYLARLTRVSYLVLDGLVMENSNQPIYADSVDHCLFLRLEIHHTGQEAIHVRGASHDIDVRGCHIYDTGYVHDQWCEGVYIGMGQPPFEEVSHVWIEGNEIHHTGHAEAINLKSRSYHVTLRGNRVHDLAPGTDTQHNEAGISCEAADRSYRPGEDTDIWIEDNEVFAVRFGRWANGIQASTMGPRIVRNHIHDCEQYGVQVNAYDDGPGALPTWLWRNTFERCGAGERSETKLSVKVADPGPNPNRPQHWYAPADGVLRAWQG